MPRQSTGEAHRAADIAVSLAPDLVETRGAGRGFAGNEPRPRFPRRRKRIPACAAILSEQRCRQKWAYPFPGSGSINRSRGSLSTGAFVRPSSYELMVQSFGRITGAEPAVTRKPGKRFAKGLELQPNASRFHTYLATLDVLQNRPAQATANAQLENEGFWRDYAVALVQQAQGDQSAADARLKDFIAKDSNGGAFQIAVFYAIRKEPDQMFKWLDTAYDTHDPGLTQLAVTPFFLPYRDDPRFTALCQKLNVRVPSSPTKP